MFHCEGHSHGMALWSVRFGLLLFPGGRLALVRNLTIVTHPPGGIWAQGVFYGCLGLGAHIPIHPYTTKPRVLGV